MSRAKKIIEELRSINEGYTQYWGFANKVDAKNYKAALKDIGTMVKANTDVLADGDGTGKPTVKPNAVIFNGKDDQSHETFALEKPTGDDFCKTAEKEYDKFVSASLIILKAWLGDQVEISSDGGNFKNGEALAKKYLTKK